jgi:hypothetical protein
MRRINRLPDLDGLIRLPNGGGRVLPTTAAAMEAHAEKALAAGQRLVADTRPEEEPCQAGTPGCCIDHTFDDGSCETW